MPKVVQVDEDNDVFEKCCEPQNPVLELPMSRKPRLLLGNHTVFSRSFAIKLSECFGYRRTFEKIRKDVSITKQNVNVYHGILEGREG